MQPLKLIIGLTGGIGSGKSSVANLFAAKGVPIIDTDDLAKKLTTQNSQALQGITQHFGTEILNSDLTLNRNKLKHIIFNDSKERLWLEKLLHPLIRSEIKSQINKIDYPYCIVVIPLLFETEPNPLIQRILVVDINEEIQLKRTQLRDNSDVELIKSIMSAQVDRHIRQTGAHDLIHNDLDFKHLSSQVDKLHEFYLNLASRNEN